MENENDNLRFNIGDFLDVIYRFWSKETSKSMFFNGLFGSATKNKNAYFNVDKAIVCKLHHHKINLSKNIRKEFKDPGKHSANGLYEFVRSDLSINLQPFLDALLERFKGKRAPKTENEAFIVDLYEKKEYVSFLFRVFAYSIFTPNMPEKPKMKTGRPKRGSHESIFYLSQSEKDYEEKRLRTKIFKSNDRLNEADLDELIELLAFSNTSFDDKEKETIATRFLKSKRSGVAELSQREMADKFQRSIVGPESENAWKFSGWKEAFDNAYLNLRTEKFMKDLRKYANEKNRSGAYRTLNDLWEIRELQASQRIASFLVKNRFYLPNISGHITHSIWGYCRRMALLSKCLGVWGEFVKELDSIYESSNKDFTINDRIKALKAV